MHDSQKKQGHVFAMKAQVWRFGAHINFVLVIDNVFL